MENRATVRVANLWGRNFGYIATRSLQILIVGTLIAIALKMVLTVQLVLLPVLIALILGASLWPLVRSLRHKMSPLAAAWTALISCVAVLGGVGTLIFFTVKMQWSTLASQAEKGFVQAKDYVLGLTDFVDQKQIDDGIQSFQDFMTSSQMGAGALSGISAVGNFFAGGILTFVILFFFLKDGDRMWRFFLSWIPNQHKEYWKHSGIQSVLTLGDYIRGTALVAAVDAVGIAIGLFAFQVPLAVPLSIIVFIGGFIPMVGATAAGILASLVALVTNGFWTALAIAIIVVVVNQLEGNFLQPKVMSKALSVHGLVILVSLTVGTVLGGIVGAVLSVPLTATAWAVIKIWTHRQTDEDKARLKHVMVLERASLVKSLR